MLIGYNNDVDHRGKTFHIQTEDRGTNDDTIETQLFCGGAILDTNITNYTELVKSLEGKEREKKIKTIMQASHRSLFKKLMAGEYDHMVGLEPLEGLGPVDSEAVDFEPGRDGVPVEALAIEEGNLEAVAQESAESHVDLSQLKNKLASLKEKSSVSEEGELSDATMIMEPPEMDSFEMEPPEPELELDEGTRQKLKDRLARKRASVPGAALSIPTSSVKAWTGCHPPSEDLSITDMVESFLNQ